MIRIARVGLCKIELPSYTIRLCDGGVIAWGAETYRGKDPTYGTLVAVRLPEEGSQESLPPLDFSMQPPNSTAVASLVQPTIQGSRWRFWTAAFDIDTGAVTGTPDLEFDGEIDQATLDLQTGRLDFAVIPKLGRLFELNIGNSQSPAFHKSIWPGETGHDSATGLGFPVAWGVEAPPAPFTGTVGAGGMDYGGYF